MANYLNGNSKGLEDIMVKYKALPTPQLYGVEDMYEEPSDQFGAGGKFMGHDPGNPNGIMRPEATAQNSSARFGQGAYAAPYQEWLRLAKFGDTAKKYGAGLSTAKDATDKSRVTYDRTSRDLGELPTYQKDWGPFKSAEYTNPINMDFFLDMSKELDRTDPNVYRFNLRNSLEAPKASSVSVADKTPRIFIPKP